MGGYRAEEGLAPTIGKVESKVTNLLWHRVERTVFSSSGEYLCCASSTGEGWHRGEITYFNRNYKSESLLLLSALTSHTIALQQDPEDRLDYKGGLSDTQRAQNTDYI